jgi:hypothetical protein
MKYGIVSNTIFNENGEYWRFKTQRWEIGQSYYAFLNHKDLYPKPLKEILLFILGKTRDYYHHEKILPDILRELIKELA